MDFKTSSLVPCTPFKLTPCFIKPHQPTISSKFIWPKSHFVLVHNELNEPLVDLTGFLHGDAQATQVATDLIRDACTNHGFFQVTNHGVDPGLLAQAHLHMDSFFKLSSDRKFAAKKMPGSLWGYSSGHAERFSAELPWKETLSFGFHDDGSHTVVVDFFKSSIGKDFEQAGVVYQRYCEEMVKLGDAIVELLALSLGVNGKHYSEYFKDNKSIMRCNYYPPCQEPGLAFGTGPHCDPTSLTILHQDQVGGLEVFVNEKWRSVKPREDAFVVNLGDTFMALTNGRYKSCLHRAMVKREMERKSIAFFMCPKGDKLLRPPKELLGEQIKRLYPDFTWSEFLNFTQNSNRADSATLQRFTSFLANH